MESGEVHSEGSAIHVRGHVDAEEVEGGGADVHQLRIIGIDGAIAKEYAGDEGSVDAVIATPGFDIVVQDLIGDLADSGFPGGSVADVIADD